MSVKRACSRHVFSGGIFIGHPCRNRAIVQRDGEWYCGTHDPYRINLKRKKDRERFEAKQQADKAVEQEARLLAERLGCGAPYWMLGIRGGGAFKRSLIITFDEANQLIKRLKERG